MLGLVEAICAETVPVGQEALRCAQHALCGRVSRPDRSQHIDVIGDTDLAETFDGALSHDLVVDFGDGGTQPVKRGGLPRPASVTTAANRDD